MIMLIWSLILLEKFNLNILLPSKLTIKPLKLTSSLSILQKAAIGVLQDPSSNLKNNLSASTSILVFESLNFFPIRRLASKIVFSEFTAAWFLAASPISLS